MAGDDDDEDDLFSWQPGARRTDPDTSQQAAEQTPNLRRHDRRLALLEHDRHPGGLTDFELGDLIGRQQTSAGKRRGELRDYGLIADSGARRPAPSGSSAIVWIITAEGRRMAEQIRKEETTG